MRVKHITFGANLVQLLENVEDSEVNFIGVQQVTQEWMRIQFVQTVLILFLDLAEHWIVEVEDVFEVLVGGPQLNQFSKQVREINGLAQLLFHESDLFLVKDVA